MLKRRDKPRNLLQSIYEKRWSTIPKHLNEATIADCTNTYALHEICFIPTAPIDAVKKIYYAHPAAAMVKNKNEDTPMSIAVDVRFEDAVHFLANSCPQACAQHDAHGSTPIISAIYVLNYNRMINSIINANSESAFITDNGGDSAFDIFFRHWNVFMRIVVHDSTNEIILNSFIGNGDWKIGDVYRNTCLFLKAANLHRTGDELDDSCMLHCALREKSCHWAFCKMLMKLHPDQILQRDSDGNLPIHIITASKDSSDEDSFLCFDCFSNKNELVNIEYINGTGKYCCEDCFEWDEQKSSILNSFKIKPIKKAHEAIKELLNIAPKMVLVSDRVGNFPLHIAIHHQHNYDIIYQLFKALPETINIRDVETNLLPFMLAALGNWESEVDQITATFQLLREDPHSVFNG